MKRILIAVFAIVLPLCLFACTADKQGPTNVEHSPYYEKMLISDEEYKQLKEMWPLEGDMTLEQEAVDRITMVAMPADDTMLYNVIYHTDQSMEQIKDAYSQLFTGEWTEEEGIYKTDGIIDEMYQVKVIVEEDEEKRKVSFLLDYFDTFIQFEEFFQSNWPNGLLSMPEPLESAPRYSWMVDFGKDQFVSYLCTWQLDERDEDYVFAWYQDVLSQYDNYEDFGTHVMCNINDVQVSVSHNDEHQISIALVSDIDQ